MEWPCNARARLVVDRRLREKKKGARPAAALNIHTRLQLAYRGCSMQRDRRARFRSSCVSARWTRPAAYLCGARVVLPCFNLSVCLEDRQHDTARGRATHPPDQARKRPPGIVDREWIEDDRRQLLPKDEHELRSSDGDWSRQLAATYGEPIALAGRVICRAHGY